DRAHEAHVAAAVHHADATLGEPRAHGARGREVRLSPAGGRTGEHRDALELMGHPSSLRRLRSAAAYRGSGDDGCGCAYAGARMIDVLTAYAVVALAIVVGYIVGRIGLLGEHGRYVLSRMTFF